MTCCKNVTSGQLASLSFFFSALFFFSGTGGLTSSVIGPFRFIVLFVWLSVPVEMTWQTALQSWSSERSCEFAWSSNYFGSGETVFFHTSSEKWFTNCLAEWHVLLNDFEKSFFVKSNMVTSKRTLSLAHST